MAQGERGELLIQGPQVFGGYWNNPEETAKTLLPGGWLRTGDLVTVDADGFTTIVDRVKELIITGGFNVSPSEVEAVLRGHPDLLDAAVVGVPSPHGGEKVVAIVLLRPGVELNADALIEFCRERLAAYKVPRDIVALDELPKSMLGKVLRKQVREEYLAAHSDRPPLRQDPVPCDRTLSRWRDCLSGGGGSADWVRASAAARVALRPREVVPFG